MKTRLIKVRLLLKQGFFEGFFNVLIFNLLNFRRIIER
jgi:hypothetical protein